MIQEVLFMNIFDLKVESIFKCGDGQNFNHIFEGDNYNSLTMLRYTHKEKINLIYIDPPYNTCKTNFSYRDNFTGNDWQKFIHSRLLLSYDLLSDDGIIFVSIDDNEVFSMGLMLDNLFGKKNRVGIFIKKINGGKNDSAFIKRSHEYLLVYIKTIKALKHLQKSKRKSSLTDQQLNKWGDNDRRSDRPNLFYPIYVSNDLNKISTKEFSGSKKIYPIRSDGSDGCWRWCQEKVEAEKNKLIIKKRSNGQLGVYVKSIAGITDAPWSSLIDCYSDGGGEDIKKYFGDSKVFSYAKNLEYIKWIISLYQKKNMIVLDFFAGSGTTGDAVLRLNANDDINRSFILCSNREDSDSDKGKNICLNICAKRIEMVQKELGNCGFNYYSISLNPNKNEIIRNTSICEIYKIKHLLFSNKKQNSSMPAEFPH